jgi:hypothetical protein|tara:strand:- start:816 stop:1019 length:204 start_codon:yes stop_codon:yes gene_type:complete
MESLTLKQVRKLLFTLSDKHLENLIIQRKDVKEEDSEFKKALLDEMANRVFIEVRNKYGIVKGNLKK